jgi:hypothetical protein
VWNANAQKGSSKADLSLLMSLPNADASKDREGQVEPGDAMNDPDDKEDNNVIGKADENIHQDQVRLGLFLSLS